MATCKDCICYESCLDFAEMIGKNIVEAVTDDHYQCEFFKDRSRFVELPCKVGDTTYFILRSFDGKKRINPEKVRYFTFNTDELKIHTTAGYFTEQDMNEGVFFTREEAEQALKERESNA